MMGLVRIGADDRCDLDAAPGNKRQYYDIACWRPDGVWPRFFFQSRCSGSLRDFSLFGPGVASSMTAGGLAQQGG